LRTGNETIDGGSGQNTLVFGNTAFENATISTNTHTGVTTIAIAGGPTDKVEDVQTVIFNDNVIKLSRTKRPVVEWAAPARLSNNNKDHRRNAHAVVAAWARRLHLRCKGLSSSLGR
jgi:hypothetical protein